MTLGSPAAKSAKPNGRGIAMSCAGIRSSLVFNNSPFATHDSPFSISAFDLRCVFRSLFSWFLTIRHSPFSIHLFVCFLFSAFYCPALSSSISQYGITWTFDKPVNVRKFVNGDFYVVGPVTIVALDPSPLLGNEVPQSEIADAEKARVKGGKYIRNGSMLNPPPRQEVAYDTGIKNYCRPELLNRPPIQLKPGDALVSTISLKVGEKSKFPYHGDDGEREHHDDSPIKTAAVLTCLAEAQPDDAFRPGYGDRRQKIYLARNLKRDLLKRLPRPPRTPEIETWIQVFQRPWLNTCFFGFDQPMENMPHYGQWVGQAQSVGGLLLMMDFPQAQKERLLINMVQVGIDYWGLVKSGHPGWEGWGGHGSGRKFPIVFAGLLLGDDEMASPTKAYPKVEFGEDNQTTYGKGWTGAKALFAGHSGIQNATGKAERPKWGPYEHLPPASWSDSQYQSESYRRANTSSSWIGQALVMRMLHAEKAWNHDAFFDYLDRWMTENDDEACRAIMQRWPDAGLDAKDKWNHEGYTWEPFIKTMWTLYRDHLDAGR
jgi:hypothetical protein